MRQQDSRLIRGKVLLAIGLRISAKTIYISIMDLTANIIYLA